MGNNYLQYGIFLLTMVGMPWVTCQSCPNNIRDLFVSGIKERSDLHLIFLVQCGFCWTVFRSSCLYIRRSVSVHTDEFGDIRFFYY